MHLVLSSSSSCVCVMRFMLKNRKLPKGKREGEEGGRNEGRMVKKSDILFIGENICISIDCVRAWRRGVGINTHQRHTTHKQTKHAGLYRHGYGAFDAIRDDPTLGFRRIVGPSSSSSLSSSSSSSSSSKPSSSDEKVSFFLLFLFLFLLCFFSVLVNVTHSPFH